MVPVPSKICVNSEYFLIRGQIRKTDFSQDLGSEKAAMPSSCGTPGGHIKEHLLSTSHVGAHIHLPSTIHSQHSACPGNPFDLASMSCRSAQMLKGLFQCSHTLQQSTHTTSLPWEPRELRKWVLGLPFNALIINIWRDISYCSVGRSSRPRSSRLGFN